MSSGEAKASRWTHDEFCFNTDLYQDDVESYMCICNRLDSARHQARVDERELAAARVATQGPSIFIGRPAGEYILLSLAIAAARGAS